MRRFINKLTPDWWTGWCWFGLFMFFWSIGWAVFGSNPFSRGMQVGLAVMWFYWLIVQAGQWYDKEIIKMGQEISDTKDKIILTQQAHINFLRGQIK